MEQTSQAERIQQLEDNLANTVTLLYGKAARKYIRGMSLLSEFEADCHKANKLQSEYMDGIRDAKSLLDSTDSMIKAMEEALKLDGQNLVV